jgi:signal transduction histidine kinase
VTPRFTSLRTRFLVAILLWVALGIGTIWFSSVRLFSSHVEEQYHEELEVHLKELAGLTLLDSAGKPYLARPLSDPRYAVPLSGFYWQISRPEFGTLKSPSMTQGMLDFDIAHSTDILHRVEDGPTGHAIVYGFVRAAPAGPPLHFVIATDERHLQRIIASFTRELTVWLGLLALSLLASGFAIITFGLRPFRTLAHGIRGLHAGQSDALAGRFPDEIQQVVTDLNAYAGRNAAIIQRARVQAGNLAHSLRTPLAVITDEAERMQDQNTPSPRALVFLDQAEQMQSHIDYHLARARSGGSRQAIGTRSRLRDIVPPLLSAMQRIHPDIAFTTLADLQSAPIIGCDPEDLSEILSNLLDNAGKWASGSVVLGWQATSSGSVIEIADDGPGIAEPWLARAFEIGVSFGGKPEGAGLGLAISRDIARDYGGDLILRNRPEGGLCVVLALPST